jgi:hypothetical protein
LTKIRNKRHTVLSKDDFISVVKVLKLSPGKSIRSISREMEIPRSAVTRIVRGTHKYFERFRLDLLELKNDLGESNPSLRYAETDEEIVRRIRYIRCPKCGARVQAQIPCFACALKDHIDQKQQFYKQKLDETN